MTKMMQEMLIQQHKLDIMDKFSKQELPKTALEAHNSLVKENFFVNAVEKEFSYQNAITIDVSNTNINTMYQLFLVHWKIFLVIPPHCRGFH